MLLIVLVLQAEQLPYSDRVAFCFVASRYFGWAQTVDPIVQVVTFFFERKIRNHELIVKLRQRFKIGGFFHGQ